MERQKYFMGGEYFMDGGLKNILFSSRKIDPLSSLLKRGWYILFPRDCLKVPLGIHVEFWI